jgi:hypothetical protein
VGVGVIAGVSVIEGRRVSVAAGVEVSAGVFVGVRLGRRVGVGVIARVVFVGIAASVGLKIVAVGASVESTSVGRGGGVELHPERLTIKIITPIRNIPIKINFLCIIPLKSPVRLNDHWFSHGRAFQQGNS